MPSQHPRQANPIRLAVVPEVDDLLPAQTPPPDCWQSIRSVAVAAGGDSSFDEIADMAMSTLGTAGLSVVAVKDGDTQAFDQQVLLLVGSGRAFPRFAELARWRPKF